jgi:hypothetical protein
MSTEHLKQWWTACRHVNDCLKRLDAISAARKGLESPGYRVYLGGELEVHMHQGNGTFSADGEVLAAAMAKLLDEKEAATTEQLQKATLELYQLTKPKKAKVKK